VKSRICLLGSFSSDAIKMADANCTNDLTYNGTYSLNEIRKIRSYMMEALWKRPTSSLNAMRVKRKCGIITNDLKEFYLYEKKPKQFTESNQDFVVELPSYFDKTLPVENLEFEIKYNEESEEKAVNFNFELESSHVSDDEELEQEQPQPPQPSQPPQPPQPSQPPQPPQPQQAQIGTKENFNYLEKDFQPKQIELNVEDEKESKRIEATNSYLKMSHECERGLCLRNLQSYEDYCLNNNEINCHVVYICDFCQIKLVSLNEMIDHLTKESHFSASEYYHENEPSTSFMDNSFPTSNFNLKCLKTRQSIKIDKQNFSYLNAIFCPKCYQFFGN
jgi:hypothetical protein